MNVSECATGNCVDGVCCSVSACPACRNCGSDGQCSVVVADGDDATGAVCRQDSGCDTTGSCKERWKLVGTQPADLFVRQFTAATTLKIFFASDSAGNAQYLKSFSPVASMFADEPLTGSPLDNIYFSNAVGYGGTLYYFGNTAAALGSGATAWTSLPYVAEAQVYHPLSIASLTTRRIYKLGGTIDIGPSLKRVTAYDVTNATWQTAGLAELPLGVSGACGGEAGGKIYLFGGFLDVDGEGRGNQKNTQMMIYNETGNTWSTLPSTMNAPDCFTSDQLVLWGSRFVVADNNALWNFDIQTLAWRRLASLPSVGAGFVVVSTSFGLFIVGYQSSPSNMLVYQWMLN